ncbi:MAG: hypothetical protein AUK34_15225 [Ignavibacteria bacterium CG2_30_36_16]|nr:PAS domain S-box protein [Ignavibacteria bacterium]OIP54529.1 MAG: hypothetical protein AUK34_15225 [Ignavibacteria bacterium CG2_30_36_16]
MNRNVTDKNMSAAGSDERRAYQKYKWLFDNSIDAVFVMKDGLFIECNPHTLQLFNCKEEEILNTSPVLFSPEFQPSGEKSSDKAKRMIDIALKEGEHTFDWTHKKKSGELFDASVSLKTLNFDEDILLMAVVRDISESKFVVNFKNLADESLIGVYLVQDGKFIYANNALLKIFGLENKNVKDNILVENVIHPDDKEVVTSNIQLILDDKIDKLHYEAKIVCPTGEIRIVEVLGSATILNNHPAIMGSLIDITETKSTHEKIRLLAHALKSIAQAVSVTDAHNKILFVNDAFLRMYGYENEDLAGWKIEDVRSDKNPAELGETIRIATLTGGWEGKIWNKRKNGSEFLAYLSTSIVKNDDGNTIALMGVVTDITEKKKWEDQVNLLTTALESAANGIVITDSNADVIWINDSFTNLTGYRFAEIVGKNVRILKSGVMDKKYYYNLWEIIKSGKVWQGEIINKKKNGDLYTEEMTITPVRIDGEEITHYIALKQDITERKKYELELKETKEAAEAANKLKSSFLANMSHELRTPMVGILGYADILNHELEATEFKEMASNLYESGNRLMDTLNLILHLSKLEANKLEIEAKVVNVDAVIQSVVKQFQKMAELRNLYINYSPAPHIHCFLEAKMLKDVLTNLVSNAIRFTNNGGVTIELKNSGSLAIINVKDTGIGISNEVQELIFEEFRQASEGINRRFEGTGLGLTISKKFVELMDGKISVESEEGAGSTFTVELPLYIENNETDKTEYRANTPSTIKDETNHPLKKVLLVENDRSSREITRLFLKKLCLLDFAEDADTAIRLVNENIYSAILMDINLDSGVSGLDVTRSIRKIAGYENTPIIALTAYALEGDKEAFIDAGCSGYLSKPFDRKTITQMLMHILEKNQK